MNPKITLIPALAALAFLGQSCDCSWFGPSEQEIERQRFNREMYEASKKEVLVSVLQKDNLDFPTNQFVILPSKKGCPVPYYHLQFPTVYTLDNQAVTIPEPEGCEFGKVAEIQRQNIMVSQTTLDAYQGPAITPVSPSTGIQIRTEGGGSLIGN